MTTLQLQHTSTTTTVSLNRPEVRNALNPTVIQELKSVLKKAEQEKKRFFVLRGNGSAFCAGADLESMRAMKQASHSENLADAQNLRELFKNLRSSPLFVITAVHGACFAGGLGLVGAADWVIADPSAQFCFSETKLGLVPAVISEFILDRANPGLAIAHMKSAQIFSTATALTMGLVHEPVTDADLTTALEARLKSLHQLAPQALCFAKTYFEKYDPTTTCETIAQLRVSPEGQEGLTSFIEKRKPSWISP